MIPRLRRAKAGGLAGSAAALVLANISSDLNRPLLCVTGHEETADSLARDISLFAGFGALRFGALLDPVDDIAVNMRALRERFKVLRELRTGAIKNPIIVTSGLALGQPVPSTSRVEKQQITLETSGETPPEKLLGVLVESGFTSEFEVEQPGQFSRRGGIVDIFGWLSRSPVRIEYFGDSIESIREFDTRTQRSDRILDKIHLTLVVPSERSGSGAKALLADHMKRDTIAVTFNEIPVEGREPAPRDRKVESALSQFARIEVGPLPATGDNSVNFDTELSGRVGGQISDVMQHLRLLTGRFKTVYLLCPRQAEIKRMRELLADYKVPARNLRLVEGRIEQGFYLGALRTAVICADELFDRYSQHREWDMPEYTPAEPFFDLEPDDYCVHEEHGICRFRGMKIMRRRGRAQEFLELEFRDNAKLYISTMQAEHVQKYIGGKRTKPVLSRLGTALWAKKKERVRRALEGIAAELISIQASRSVKKGFTFPADTSWQREFEASFPFTDTRDQTRTSSQVKEDMQSVRPMDRLMAGDVGYGKTEIAMRAAFKAVEAGKQVAILVPTTVLAQQHYNTFRERMADYPFFIDVLSRFRDRSSQASIIENTAKGDVDILIGTHRLLSGDVVFKDLGLVIVDEEQRFGVIHKEHFKHLRKTVDVLTLTATPIPRTLHMALIGVKDISTLATPPRGRESIATSVTYYDERIIREAILREITRGGQVFFVHNRVHNIENIRRRLEEILPEAVFMVAHGQMGERQLEETMLAFVNRKADVLVCTTIIESGLDIPNVNSIFINDAQNYGLADMHQLRGRVGRYKHQAFAYFFLPRKRAITKAAKRRLQAIQEFDELGAGFKLAMRDLEIRGAGNLLGREQSGHIAVVGYDLYCRLLSEAVKKSRMEVAQEPPEVEIDLEIEAYLPEDYLPDGRQRISFYRKISAARSDKELEEVKAELNDRCGPLPLEAGEFFAKHRLRIRLQGLRITYIGIREKWLALQFEELRKLKPLSAKLGAKARLVGEDFLYVDLPRRKPASILNYALKTLSIK
jgi:transcription-repair coupling factor (superfamily II helicase)